MMPMRKTTIFFLVVAAFLLGFWIADTIHLYPHYLHLMMKSPSSSPAESESGARIKLPPDTFLESLTLAELSKFDQLYEERQNQLRDIMSAGSQDQTLLVPKGVFAQREFVQSRLDSLSALRTSSELQSGVKQSFLTAYRFLKGTFDQEVEFLKQYPAQGENISFVTQNIFDISAKDQRSGLQFLDCLVRYRKLLAGAIREDETPEKNQSRVADLVSINTLIDKYQARLNVPKENV